MIAKGVQGGTPKPGCSWSGKASWRKWRLCEYSVRRFSQRKGPYSRQGTQTLLGLVEGSSQVLPLIPALRTQRWDLLSWEWGTRTPCPPPLPPLRSQLRAFPVAGISAPSSLGAPHMLRGPCLPELCDFSAGPSLGTFPRTALRSSVWREREMAPFQLQAPVPSASQLSTGEMPAPPRAGPDLEMSN